LGRASDALEVIDGLEDRLGYRHLLAHLPLYLRGRAYEASGDTELALRSYEELVATIGDGVREVVLFRDTPERIARLKRES
jgi:hypothetical protein